MRSYERFVITLLLSNFLPVAGCAKERNSLSIQAESLFSAEVIEHTVPFKEYKDIPLVNCNLNGDEAIPFLVDTGASTNIVDYEYAKAVGILPTS